MNYENTKIIFKKLNSRVNLLNDIMESRIAKVEVSFKLFKLTRELWAHKLEDDPAMSQADSIRCKRSQTGKFSVAKYQYPSQFVERNGQVGIGPLKLPYFTNFLARNVSIGIVLTNQLNSAEHNKTLCHSW